MDHGYAKMNCVPLKLLAREDHSFSSVLLQSLSDMHILLEHINHCYLSCKANVHCKQSVTHVQLRAIIAASRMKEYTHIKGLRLST